MFSHLKSIIWIYYQVTVKQIRKTRFVYRFFKVVKVVLIDNELNIANVKKSINQNCIPDSGFRWDKTTKRERKMKNTYTKQKTTQCSRLSSDLETSVPISAQLGLVACTKACVCYKQNDFIVRVIESANPCIHTISRDSKKVLTHECTNSLFNNILMASLYAT